MNYLYSHTPVLIYSPQSVLNHVKICPDLYTSIHPEPCQNNNYLYSHTPALIYTPQFILNHVKIIITYIPIPCPDLYTSIHPKPCQNITYLYSHTLPWSIHLNPSWTMSKYYLFIFPYPALICTPQSVLNHVKILLIYIPIPCPDLYTSL